MGLDHLLHTEFPLLTNSPVFSYILPGADHISSGTIARLDQVAMIGKPAIGTVGSLKTILKLVSSFVRGRFQLFEYLFLFVRMDVLLPEGRIIRELGGGVSGNFLDAVADKSDC